MRLPVLLTAPADPLRVGDANRQLAQLGIPWRFGAQTRSPVLALVAEVAQDSTTATVRAFEGTPVRFRYPLMASPGGDNSPNAAASRGRSEVLATAGGSPWVVAGPGYVVIGSPINPDATDLPLRAAFVPWLLETLARRLGDDGQVIVATPGSTVRGLRDVSGIERPDGSVTPLTGERLTLPQQPGVYFLRRQNARVGAIVVNAEAEESDVRGMGGESATSMLTPLVTGSLLQTLNAGPAWQSAVFSQAAGQALLLPLIALALLALLAEAWLSGR
jgi:hypothetical protein